MWALMTFILLYSGSVVIFTCLFSGTRILFIFVFSILLQLAFFSLPLLINFLAICFLLHVCDCLHFRFCLSTVRNLFFLSLLLLFVFLLLQFMSWLCHALTFNHDFYLIWLFGRFILFDFTWFVDFLFSRVFFLFYNFRLALLLVFFLASGIKDLLWLCLLLSLLESVNLLEFLHLLFYIALLQGCFLLFPGQFLFPTFCCCYFLLKKQDKIKKDKQIR